MDLDTIRELILKTPLVKKLPKDVRMKFVMALLWVSKTREVKRTNILFKKGDKGEDLGCVLLEGMVRVVTEGSQDKTITAPDILGEVNLFTKGGERTATVEVVVGGQILTFAWRDLGTLVRDLFDEDERAQLKDAISKSAWSRDATILTKRLVR